MVSACRFHGNSNKITDVKSSKWIGNDAAIVSYVTSLKRLSSGTIICDRISLDPEIVFPRRNPASDTNSDDVAPDLNTLDASLARLDLKQVAELARSADVADVDIAHRQCEIGVLAFAAICSN